MQDSCWMQLTANPIITSIHFTLFYFRFSFDHRFLLSFLSGEGGRTHEATVLYKRLASRLAMKWEYPYCSTMSWLSCHLMISLLCSAIQCIWGAHSTCGHKTKSPPPTWSTLNFEDCVLTIWIFNYMFSHTLMFTMFLLLI